MPPVIAALIIFLVTYLFIGLRQIPRVHIDRPVGALVGAVLMVVFGVLTLEQAFAAVDMHTQTKEKGQMTVTVVSSDPAAPKRDLTVVLLCDTVEERAKGLQGFRQLRKDEAALFVLEQPGQAAFWMGSVVYPIDIVFIDLFGNVVRVYPVTQPGSREYYHSGVPVKWVLETAAGAGIKVGDNIIINNR